MPSNAHAVFRFDASAEIGGGHAMRCSTLAKALQQEGWGISIVTRKDSLGFLDLPAADNVVVVLLGDDPGNEAAETMNASPHGCDLVVVDHYGRDFAYETALSGWARQRLIIDDLADRRHECEFLCDQTPGRTAAEYAPLLPDYCRVLTGSDYALLRPEFAALRKHTMRRRIDGIERVLISFGMSDPANLTAIALHAFAMVGFSGAIDIILGSAAPHATAIAKQLDQSNLNARLLLDTPNVAKLMSEADLAIGAGGTASLERCCLGLPTLLCVLADNQRANAAALARSGAVVTLGDASNLNPALLAESFAEIEADSILLRQTREAALRIVDGRGTPRLLMQLRPEKTVDGNILSLQRVKHKDAQILYDWQCHENTRRFSRNSTIPSWEEHLAWLEKRLADPLALFNLVTCDDIPAGVLRLDPLSQPSVATEIFEVSILVAPNYYRRGIGAAALRLARRLVPDAEIRATVLPENHASHRLFQRAGYSPVVGGYRQLP